MPVALAFALLPAALVALVAALRAPLRFLLALYAFLLPFGSAISLPIGLPPPFDTPTSVVGLLVIAGILVHLLFVPRSAPRLLPAVPVWLAFATFVGLSFAWSVDARLTVDEVAILLSLVILYALVMLMPVEKADLRRVEEAVVLGGAVAGAYGIALLLGSGFAVTNNRFAVAGGVGKGIDPNITAATLVLPLAIAVGRATRATTNLARVAFWTAGALIAAAIVLTGSRGGILSALAVIAVLVLNHPRRARIAIVGLGIVVIAAGTLAIAPDGLQRRITRPGSSGRTDIWRTALTRCDRFCIAGSGYGTFPTVYQDALHSEPSARGMDLPFVAHSIWIGALIETGIVGALLMVFALALVGRDLLRLPMEVRGPPLAGFVGVLVASTFLSTLGFKYFWMVLIYAGLSTLAHETESAAAARTRPVHVPRMIVRQA
ncbi:MAG: O-antigen ligase family protein [Actinomycetota bacterium]